MSGKNNIGFGIFLIVVGILWMLMNVGVIGWSVVDSLIKLWPLILAVAGINIIFSNNGSVKLTAWLLFLVIVVLHSCFNERIPYNEASNRARNINIQKLEETTNAALSLSLGGTRIQVGSSATDLVNAIVDDPGVKHRQEYQHNRGKAEISFNKSGTQGWNHHKAGNSCVFNLNRDVIWEMNVKLGAINGTFDMSDLKVGELDMDIGAGNIELLFGSRFETVNVKIDAGASKLDIVVPEGTGVRIKVDGVLNKAGMNDLDLQQQGGYYVSPNYAESENKINMDINMGVGKLDIRADKVEKSPTI
jgi:hypothetical protein